MPESAARAALVRRLRAAAVADPRIVGLLDYGSGGKGRLDEWSDLDVEVFIRDADLKAFAADWQTWAARLGPLLLAYRGHIGHPWAVYDADPTPLRVDFDLHPVSALPEIARWPSSFASLEEAVLYDSSGELTAVAAPLVRRFLRPDDLQHEFAVACGDFWYYLLYVQSKLRRGAVWVARPVYHVEVLEPLLRLLRIEADALEWWRGSPGGLEIEQTVSPARLARLETCVPGAGGAGMQAVLLPVALLGRDLCAALARRHGWDWPHQLADRCVTLLTAEAEPTRQTTLEDGHDDANGR